MSAETSVRTALQTQLATVSPAISTAYENQKFVPTPGTPYQQVSILFADPDNPEVGTGFRIQGFMQVMLQYPLGAGSAAIEAQALLVRAAFVKNSTLSSGGVNVTINRTPAIGNGRPDGDRWALPVTIRFHANQF